MVGADDVRQCFRNRERFATRAFQIEIKLRVRITRLELVSQLERQRSLADSAQPMQAGDGDSTLLQLCCQFRQFIGAPSEVVDWRWKLVECCRDRAGCRLDLNDLVASYNIT